MNRERLRTVGDEVARLRTAPSSTNDAKVTHETRLTAYPDRVSPIDTLDMDTWHSSLATPGDCRTLGCIAGVTVCLHPDEAREIGARNDKETGLHPSVGEIAQQILELSDDECYALFHSQSRSPVTPEQATAAIDRLLAGEDPEGIWEQTRSPPEADPAGLTEDTTAETGLADHNGLEHLREHYNGRGPVHAEPPGKAPPTCPGTTATATSTSCRPKTPRRPSPGSSSW